MSLPVVGEIAHVNVPYEIPHDNVIIDKNFRILVYNGAHLVPAKVGHAFSITTTWSDLSPVYSKCYRILPPGGMAPVSFLLKMLSYSAARVFTFCSLC